MVKNQNAPHLDFQLLRKLQENSLSPSEDISCKNHVKKPATLLNIYYFTSIFQGISLGLKQSESAVAAY